MGCGGSAPAKDLPPNGAPDDWKATLMATFRLLDKDGSGMIALVPYKKRETIFSEISVLGETVIEKQKEMGDFEAKEAIGILDWVEIVKGKIEAKGWGPVNELLEAIDAAVANPALNQCEQIAKKVFKEMDSGWADPANTGSLDFIAECEALADKTSDKAKGLLVGLVSGTKLSSSDWVSHCAGKIEPLGWPRVQKQLKSIDARLEKVSDTGDMTAGM